MDIEVGEYVRTKEGYIAKCIEIGEDGDYSTFDNYIEIQNGYTFFYDNELDKITKHSHNIIDLIEARDIVNGSKVIDKVFCDGYDGKIYIYLEQVTTGALEPTSNKEIKTILTHEQYESNCYRLED